MNWFKKEKKIDRSSEIKQLEEQYYSIRPRLAPISHPCAGCETCSAKDCNDNIERFINELKETIKRFHKEPNLA